MEGAEGVAGCAWRKVACGLDPTAQRHDPRGTVCLGKRRRPFESGPTSERARGPGDDAPFCGVDFVGGPRGGGGIWHLRCPLLAVWFSAS